MATLLEIQPRDPAWADVLCRHQHDCYHMAEYLTLMAAHEPGATVSGLLYRHDDAEAFLPIVVRPLPAHLGPEINGSDFFVPYGYGGPVGPAIADATAFSGWLNAVKEWALQKNIVSGFLRWHPLLPSPLDSNSGDLQIRGATVAVDLEAFCGAYDDAPRPTHRSEIRWLLRNNYTIAWDAWEYFEDFQRLYAATMARLSAKASYHYSAEYFDQMKRRLSNVLHLGVVLTPTQTVAAAALFTECSGIVQYSLSASDEGLSRKSPTKLLIAAARSWAKSRGNKWLHLGGGLGSDRDRLFQFKAGFSDFVMPFAISQFVFDQCKYDALVARATTIATAPTSSPYFPAYRALLEHAAP
jgi:hypothetical protein